MILFQLVCPDNHPFESWFRDSAAFDELKCKDRLSCPHCGSHMVDKALMAPAVKSVRDDGPAKPANRRPSEQDVALIRKHIDANSEYVGMKFVTEARRIHAGDAPERMIHGEAKPADALKLLEDGVSVMPLPFTPQRKMN